MIKAKNDPKTCLSKDIKNIQFVFPKSVLESGVYAGTPAYEIIYVV